MNLKEIRQMVNLMNENDIMEIEVEREGTKVKIKKSFADIQPQIITKQIDRNVEIQQVSIPQDQAPKVSLNRTDIKSPMVGTFYRASAPDAAPYVDIGQVIEVGQVLCIVEAMKLMNEIKSEVRGKIVEILVENANPVEFGQVLFVVEPV